MTAKNPSPSTPPADRTTLPIVSNTSPPAPSAWNASTASMTRVSWSATRERRSSVLFSLLSCLFARLIDCSSSSGLVSSSIPRAVHRSVTASCSRWVTASIFGRSSGVSLQIDSSGWGRPNSPDQPR